MTYDQAEYLANYYSSLKNCLITNAGITRDTEFGGVEYWPTLTVQDHITGNTWTIEVSRDFEGNGPGHLLGLPTPE